MGNVKKIITNKLGWESDIEIDRCQIIGFHKTKIGQDFSKDTM